MTMDFPPLHIDHIARSLEIGPVTYHTASRDLSIHVDLAKKLLFAYYGANKSRVSASLLVSGTRNGQGVLKVFESELDLEENRHLYMDSVACVHVYCITLTKNAFSSSEIAMAEMNHPVPSEGGDILGITKGPDLIAREGLNVGSSVKRDSVKGDLVKGDSVKGDLVKGDSVKGVKEISVGNSVNPKTNSSQSNGNPPENTTQNDNSSSVKPKLVYQSRKQQPKPSVLSNYVSRKNEKPPVKRPAEEAPKFQYKSRKLEAKQPKERVVMSNAEPHDVDEEPLHPNPSSHADLQNLFMDDFSDEDLGSLPEKNEPIIVESETSVPPMDDQCQNDGQSDGQSDGQNDKEKDGQNDKEKDGDRPDPSLPVQDSILSALPLKVSEDLPAEPVVSETIVDEDGYFTSYKQTPKPEPKPAPAREQPKPRVSKPAKEKAGKDGKKQSSLMNFFGKR